MCVLQKHHYRELSAAVQASLGSVPDEYITYFTSRFPRLVSHVYDAMMCCEEERTFHQYYHAQQPQPHPKQSTAQPAEQPTVQSTKQSTAQPAEQSTAQSTKQSTAQPDEQSTAQPGKAAQPAEQPTGQSTNQSTAQPAEHSTEQSTNQSTAQPAGQLTAGRTLSLDGGLQS